MSLGEFELISSYFLKACKNPDLIVANGDDAAVIRPQGNLAVAVDTLVAGVHFPEDADAALIARRALRVNLSDMAAMAARPKWFTLSLTMPEANPDWLEQFSRGLFVDAELFDCHLIGGDTTKGPLNITIQILGELPADHAGLKRSGAVAGDLLVATGTLGGAGAALDKGLCSDLGHETPDSVLRRYWLPEPRIEFALHCQHLINAALDISDGLLADTGHICSQSGVEAQINLGSLPLSKQVIDCWGDKAASRAMTSGDDYELCMAVPKNSWNEMQRIAGELDVPVTILGEFKPMSGSQPTVTVLDNQGQPIEMPSSGYHHF
jgi:thiamine-monophosphate kinase